MVIYAAQCRKCSIQYTGRTVQELRSRISGHRGWMNKSKSQTVDVETKHDEEDEGALAEHLKTVHGLKTTDDFDINLQSFRFVNRGILLIVRVIGSET